MQVEPRDVALADVTRLRRAHRSGRSPSRRASSSRSTSTPSCRARIHTDPQRLQQILKNLLANAFKFTEQRHGDAARAAGRSRARASSNEALRKRGARDRLRGDDTGIGIPQDKQQLIFEAFQQADGTTSRKYGGTGLGLSISREIARLLGGEIHVESDAGQGQHVHALPARALRRRRRPSDGVVDAPRSSCGADASAALRRRRRHADAAGRARPDRRRGRSTTTATTSGEGDRVLLVIEDDLTFARIMLGMAREKGFKVVVATRGDTGLALANELPARRDHARHPAAGARRLDGARSPQAQPAHAPHPGARHLGRRAQPARRRAGRVRLPREAGQQGGAGGRLRAHLDASSIDTVRQLLLVEDDDTQRQTHRRAGRRGRRRRGHGGAHRGGGAGGARDGRVRLHGRRPGAARRRRHPADREGASASRRSRELPIDRLHRQGSDARGRGARSRSTRSR